MSLLNKPFSPEENLSDAKNRFLLRRFKVIHIRHYDMFLRVVQYIIILIVHVPFAQLSFSLSQLLEQALAIEEQLHRASSAGLVQDPNKAVMLLHSRQGTH